MPEDDSKKGSDQKQPSGNDPGQEESGNPQGAEDQPDEKNAESQKEQPKKKDQQDQKKKRNLPIKLLLIGGVILLIILFFGFRYWRNASTHEETDDAYTTGNTHQISPRITGTVEQVLVDDNWHVTAGQLLVKLDRRDYEVALSKNRAQLKQANAQVSQAKAGLEQANAELRQRQAQVTQAAAQVVQSQANFDIAKINYDRDHSLFQKDLRAVAKQDVDTTKANLDSAQGALNAAKATQTASQAQVEAGKAAVDSAEAQLESANANVAASEAAVRDSELQLSYCNVIAPVSGRIAQKTVQTGNRLTVGQALMAVVEDNVWILANLKETQLERVQIGQPVEIKIDALPHYKFAGRVDSMQPGSGSNFALLPPDNATGNFIKIVQRVPIKILFDPESIRPVRDKIVPGLSTEPSIAITEKPIARPYENLPDQKASPSGPDPLTQVNGGTATGVVQ
jgi:membrane fusion protein (multidrug efflux system)